MSGVLVDTHVLIWLVADDHRLGDGARALIEAGPQVYFSAASIWELEIKRGLGKVSFPDGLANDLTESGLRELAISSRHAESVCEVVLPHRDPFDRLLAAQARVEQLSLITADSVLLAHVAGSVDARS